MIENDGGDNDTEADTRADYQEVNINVSHMGCRISKSDYQDQNDEQHLHLKFYNIYWRFLLASYPFYNFEDATKCFEIIEVELHLCMCH